MALTRSMIGSHDGYAAIMQMPLMFESIGTYCHQAAKNPLRMLLRKSAGHMQRSLRRRQTIPVCGICIKTGNAVIHFQQLTTLGTAA
ncbi:hypothetical protein BIL_07170 [Bifidobacterium longum subsp. longum F8]|nr:hypothetical protein BIL_07170 [Bifidobacterium longum subsp. longum F8]